MTASVSLSKKSSLIEFIGASFTDFNEVADSFGPAVCWISSLRPSQWLYRLCVGGFHQFQMIPEFLLTAVSRQDFTASIDLISIK